jgi:hypothetical protein
MEGFYPSFHLKFETLKGVIFPIALCLQIDYGYFCESLTVHGSHKNNRNLLEREAPYTVSSAISFSYD